MYRRVARDFPPIAYPPLHKLRAQLAQGAVEGVLCERQGLAAAYAFLLRALLEHIPGAAGLYAEVEKEELAPDAAERRTRAAHRLLRAAGLFARRGAVLLSSTAPRPIPAIRMPRPLRARPCPD